MLEMAVANIYLRTEGIDAVLSTLQRAGIGGLALTTYYEELTAPGEGTRFPTMIPAMDRRVLGQNEMHVIIHSAFAPTTRYYGATRIQPLAPPPDAGTWGNLLGEAIDEARRRGMKVAILDAPLAVPPKLGGRPVGQFAYPWPEVGDEDCKAVRVDGERITGVEAKGCPNNPDVRQHAFGRIRDILAHYPRIDALTLDHVEFPTYTLEDNFACFCEHCHRRAEQTGYDWQRMRQDATELLSNLRKLTNDVLLAVTRRAGLLSGLDLCVAHPGFLDLVRFKLDSIDAFLVEVRALMQEMGSPDVLLSLTGFTPAFGIVASRDYRRLATRCDVLIPKFYMEHWVRILAWWVDRLTQWNPDLDPGVCLQAVYRVLGFESLNMPRRREELDLGSGVAVPVEMIDLEATRILDAVQHRADIRPAIHLAGTADLLEDKLRALHRYGMGAMLWGYFFASDEKLQVMRRLRAAAEVG